MKNILLLQPKVGDMDWMRSNPSPPLGILHASTLLSKDYQVKILDQRVSPDWKKILKTSINKDTLFVGISSYTGPMIREGLKMSEATRELSDLPIVWGGIHPTLLPEQTLQDDRVDMVVIGEGEETLLDLARSLESGNSLDLIKGVFYKYNGNIKKNLPREFLDLDTLPDIPYHLLDISQYLPIYQGGKSLYFQASRGCPHACTFCSEPVYNHRKWRGISAPIFRDRITSLLKKYQFDNVYFVDDNFFTNLNWSLELVTVLNDLGIAWQAQGLDIQSLKQMNNKYLDYLRKSRCRRVSIGIESGSQRVRNLLGKSEPLQEIVEEINRLNSFGITIYCSFMSGIPTESYEECKMSLDLMLDLIHRNLNVRCSPLYIFKPYPQTQILGLALSEGFQIPQSLEEWGSRSSWENLNYRKIKSPQTNDKLLPKGDSIYFVSLFLDDKVSDYVTNKVFKMLARIYRRFAAYRIKKMIFSFLIEKHIFNLIRYGLSKF